jgi:hypothetical protein
MKKLVTEVPDEGLESLLGQRVTLFCMNYFYTGDLVSVNETDVLLEDAHIIYETGAWTSGKWKDAQRVADRLYVRTAAIESYAVIW